MKDAESWYLLGNAHLMNTFMCDVSQFTKQLESALKAYSFAEKYAKSANNPDLYFNRATVLEYLERYTEAILNFEQAHQIDPNLKGNLRAQAILGHVQRTSEKINTKAKIKSKQLATMCKSLQ